MVEASKNLLEKLRKWNLRSVITSSFGYALEDGMTKVVVEEVHSELSKYKIPRKLEIKPDYDHSGNTQVYVRLERWEQEDLANMCLSGFPPPSRHFRVKDWVSEFVHTTVEEGKGYKLRDMLQKRKTPFYEVIREVGAVRPKFFGEEVKYFVDRLYEWTARTNRIENPESVIQATVAEKLAVLPIT